MYVYVFPYVLQLRMKWWVKYLKSVYLLMKVHKKTLNNYVIKGIISLCSLFDISSSVTNIKCMHCHSD